MAISVDKQTNNTETSLRIVTPTRNSASFLEQTLVSTSLLRQIGAEHVIVDSDSVDDTVIIARRHGIQCLAYPPGNMYEAINFGLQKSDTEWCTYLNSDDVLFPRAFTEAMRLHENDADIIYGNADYIDSDGRFLHQWSSANPASLRMFFSAGILPFPQMGTFFRRSVYDELNGFNEEMKYSADFDFFLRALLKGFRFARFDGPPLAAFRVHGEQLSQRVDELMSQEVFHSLERNLLYDRKACASLVKLLHRSRNALNYVQRIIRGKHICGEYRVRRTFDE